MISIPGQVVQSFNLGNPVDLLSEWKLVPNACFWGSCYLVVSTFVTILFAMIVLTQYTPLIYYLGGTTSCLFQTVLCHRFVSFSVPADGEPSQCCFLHQRSFKFSLPWNPLASCWSFHCPFLILYILTLPPCLWTKRGGLHHLSNCQPLVANERQIRILTLVGGYRRRLHHIANRWLPYPLIHCKNQLILCRLWLYIAKTD
jgi:hypothetical protein